MSLLFFLLPLFYIIASSRKLTNIFLFSNFQNTQQKHSLTQQIDIDINISRD